ncbi:MAG: PilZ domain-containing protein [Myxococcota bacterium]
MLQTPTRRSPRRLLPVPLRVELGSPHQTELAYALDLSRDGLCVQLPGTVPPGARIRLRFRLPLHALPIEASAEVAWVRPARESPVHFSEAGLRFEEIPPQQRELLDEFVCRAPCYWPGDGRLHSTPA